MKDKKLREVESAVLKVYRTTNPSTYEIEKSKQEFDHVTSFMENLLFNKLKFPSKMFKDASLLDFGTGTGENSLHYLINGAQCTFVEINTLASERADFIFKKYAPDPTKYKIIKNSLFDFRSDDKFDIVASLGVIHRTQNKERAFKHKVSFLKDGGFMILGIANSAGFFQRNLQRQIIYSFSTDENEIVMLAEYFFSQSLDRAEKFGRRSRKAIIYDTYVNPCIDTPTIKELINLFNDNNMSLYSSWPPIMPSLIGDSATRNSLDISDIANLISIPEILWIAHNKDDRDHLIPINEKLNDLITPVNELSRHLNNREPGSNIENNFIIEEITKLLSINFNSSVIFEPYIKTFMTLLFDVKKLITALNTKDKRQVKKIIDTSETLFKGTSGLGMNYFIGTKNPKP